MPNYDLQEHMLKIERTVNSQQVAIEKLQSRVALLENVHVRDGKDSIWPTATSQTEARKAAYDKLYSAYDNMWDAVSPANEIKDEDLHVVRYQTTPKDGHTGIEVIVTYKPTNYRVIARTVWEAKKILKEHVA